MKIQWTPEAAAPARRFVHDRDGLLAIGAMSRG